MTKIETLALYCLFNIFLIFLAHLAERNKGCKSGQIYLRFVFVAMWAFFTFSGSRVGSDSGEYERLFFTAIQDFNFYFFRSDMEPLFFVFNAIIRSFTNSFIVYKSICGLIIFGLTYNVINYFKDKLNLTFIIMVFVLFVYYDTFNVMRLCMATSIVLFGFKYYYNKQYKKFTFFAAIALAFHFSAIIPILFGCFAKLMNRRVKPFLFITIGIVVFFLSMPKTIENFAFVNRYEGYLQENFTSYVRENFTSIIKGLIVLSLPCIMVLYYCKLERQKLYGTEVFYSTCGTYISILILSVLAPILTRATLYLFMPMLISMSLLIFQIKHTKHKQLMYTSLTLYYIVMFIYNFFASYNFLFLWR